MGIERVHKRAEYAEEGDAGNTEQEMECNGGEPCFGVERLVFNGAPGLLEAIEQPPALFAAANRAPTGGPPPHPGVYPPGPVQQQAAV